MEENELLLVEMLHHIACILNSLAGSFLLHLALDGGQSSHCVQEVVAQVDALSSFLSEQLDNLGGGGRLPSLGVVFELLPPYLRGFSRRRDLAKCRVQVRFILSSLASFVLEPLPVAEAPLDVVLQLNDLLWSRSQSLGHEQFQLE